MRDGGDRLEPKTAFLFPGQGSQKIGMGRAWAEAFPEARAAFDEASEALGLDVAKLCWEGPEADLQLTANTQPAILTASVSPAAASSPTGAPMPRRSRARSGAPSSSAAQSCT